MIRAWLKALWRRWFPKPRVVVPRIVLPPLPPYRVPQRDLAFWEAPDWNSAGDQPFWMVPPLALHGRDLCGAPRIVSAIPRPYTERDWRVIVDNEHPDDLAYYFHGHPGDLAQGSTLLNADANLLRRGNGASVFGPSLFGLR